MYNPTHAAHLLWQRSREVTVGSGRVGSIRFRRVEEHRSARKKRRKRLRWYGKEVLVPLRRVGVICDGICEKRLAPYRQEIVPKRVRLGELLFDNEVRDKLLRISPATVDRLLAPARKRYELRARSTTKPRTLLKHQIPIRAFSDWDEARPGFVEIDLVSHEGRDPRSDYAYALDAH